jgi:hypothetical protein
MRYETIRKALNPEDGSNDFVRDIGSRLLLTRSYIPEHLILHEYRYENLIYHI